MSDNKLIIRKAAIQLLEKLYLQSDCYLKATIDVSEMLTDKFDKLIFQKAGLYLAQKHLVETTEIVSNKWTATITYEGIDWLEDNYEKYKEHKTLY